MKKRILFVIMVMCTVTICSCGKGETVVSPETTISVGESNVSEQNETNGKVDDTLFTWEGNVITGLTEKGAKKENIIIPGRCEGFDGCVFMDASAKVVSFESDKDIDIHFAFSGAKNLESIALPDKLTVIPTTAFEGCERLQEITFPSTLISLESYAFSYCESLEKVTFKGNQLKEIGEYCFRKCYGLQSITIPEGVETIKQYAFTDCSSITEINLSSTVKNIEKFAFNKTGISEIHFPADIQFDVMDNSAFGTVAYTTVVYIAKDSWCDQNRDKWNIGFKEIKYQ